MTIKQVKVVPDGGHTQDPNQATAEYALINPDGTPFVPQLIADEADVAAIRATAEGALALAEALETRVAALESPSEPETPSQG